ncbi:hypothetical protein PCASD_06742 [Puccinia coronata f. sp. avenae]|nr:hypothetical protein PCASD_06742 [Puccinia coronata f. sp. avenae]
MRIHLGFVGLLLPSVWTSFVSNISTRGLRSHCIGDRGQRTWLQDGFCAEPGCYELLTDKLLHVQCDYCGHVSWDALKTKCPAHAPNNTPPEDSEAPQ